MSRSRPHKQHEHCVTLAAVVHRASGKRGQATITRLWYDGCEMMSDELFGAGEQVEIEIGGMGRIRGVVCAAKGMVIVRFIEECPV